MDEASYKESKSAWQVKAATESSLRTKGQHNLWLKRFELNYLSSAKHYTCTLLFWGAERGCHEINKGNSQHRFLAT
jgi:hypothetical protein